MRWAFWICLIISLLIHVILFDVFNLKNDKSENQKPIEVQLVPKEKVKESQKPDKQVKKIIPIPKIKRAYPDKMPLDEGLDTKMDQSAPALSKETKNSNKGNKGKSNKQTADKQAEAKQQPQKLTQPKSAVKDNQPSKLPETPAQSTADVPKVSSETAQEKALKAQKEAEKKRMDDIMNPKDVIEKYANGGEALQGQDSVSMQYVKMKYQSYFAKFARRLYQVWVYPPDAAMRGEQGTVQASFIVGRDGKISSIRILRSSGYPDLDNEVMAALKRMYGVPLPESYDLDTLKVDAFFRYIIGGGFVIY